MATPAANVALSPHVMSELVAPSAGGAITVDKYQSPHPAQAGAAVEGDKHDITAAWLLSNALPTSLCSALIAAAENAKFEPAAAYCGMYTDRQVDRVLIDDNTLVSARGRAVARHTHAPTRHACTHAHNERENHRGFVCMHVRDTWCAACGDFLCFAVRATGRALCAACVGGRRRRGGAAPHCLPPSAAHAPFACAHFAC